MKRHALFVGVDKYHDSTIQNLNYPSEDAAELASAFRLLLKFDRAEKLLNPDHADDILDAVKDMSRGLGQGDLFLFFFAGHGFRVKDNHVLVCGKDGYEDLKDEDAGLRVGRLKRRMAGPWSRMLVLDACQNDIRATRGVEAGATARDLKLIHTSLPGGDSGCQIVVTSCSEGQRALEVSDLGHGLFTSALLASVRSLAEARRRIDMETLRSDLGDRMGSLIVRYRLSGEQVPLFTMPPSAAGIVLLDGAAPMAAPPPSLGRGAAPVLVVCPVCGRKNRPEDTFTCRECGRDNLCNRHQDEDTFLCADCAKARKEADRRRCEEAAALVEEGKRLEEAGDPWAADCFRRAADLGDRGACHVYGDLLFQGKLGVEKNVSAALEYYCKADLANIWIPFNIASCHLHFYEETKEQEEGRKAVEWLRKSAEAGLPWACVKLADCYRDGVGVARDYARAKRWYGKALDPKGLRYRSGEDVFWAENGLANTSVELLLKRIALPLGQDWMHFRLVSGVHVCDAHGRDVPLAGPVASDRGVFIGVTPEGLRLDANAPLPDENPAWPFAKSVSEHCGIPTDWFIAALVLPDSFPEPAGGLPFWAIRESNAAAAMLGMKPTDRYRWDDERQDLVRRLETLPMSPEGAERNALLHFEAPVPEWRDGMELLQKITNPSESFVARTGKALEALPPQIRTRESNQVKNWLVPFLARP